MHPLATRLAQATRTDADGVWQRHVEAAWVATALDGRAAPGRWGNTGGHLVLYPGRPLDSVVVEAYRHLVDPVVTDDGEALTLFVDLLPAGQRPVATATEEWAQLPRDPRERPAV